MKYIKLGDISEVIGGQIMTRIKTEKPGDVAIETRRVIVPKAITEEGLIDKSVLPQEELKTEADEKKITKEGDIVIKLNSPYDSAVITEETKGCIVPSFCAIIRLLENPGITPSYIQAFLNSRLCKDQIDSSVQGAIMTLVTVGKLREIEIPLPEETKQHSIGSTYLETLDKLKILKEIIELEKQKNDAFFYELED